MKPDPHRFRVTAIQLARAQRWPIGTPVTVTQDAGTGHEGERVETVTTGAPFRNGRVWKLTVEGLNGAYPLARIVERTQS